MHIVDRRLNPGSKSLENRQRFLRRAKALVQGAVKKSSEDRDIKDVLEGGEVSILRCTNLLPKLPVLCAPRQEDRPVRSTYSRRPGAPSRLKYCFTAVEHG